jgi:hypothetical protein
LRDSSAMGFGREDLKVARVGIGDCNPLNASLKSGGYVMRSGLCTSEYASRRVDGNAPSREMEYPFGRDCSFLGAVVANIVHSTSCVELRDSN